MHAVIMAAGSGTRLHPLTLTQSKPMIPVANRPIIGWTLEFLASLEKVFVIARRDQHDLLAYLKNFENVAVIFQEEQLGTGHALLQAKNHVAGKFLVLNGDDFYGRDDLAAMAARNDRALGIHRSSQPEKYGVVAVEKGMVTGIEEKPQHPTSDLISCGMSVLDERVFPFLEKLPKSPRGEYELTDAIAALIAAGDVHAHEVATFIPMSYPWSMLDVNEYILKTKGSMIDPTAVIRSGVVLEEPVAIGAGTVIGPNCFIRKHTSIGSHCRIDQGVEIKNSIVMDSTFVSHNAYVGDSIVGRNCDIAAGSIFANLRLDGQTVKVEVNDARMDSGTKKLGAIVGDNVRFGVRVTVMPGKRIWPNLNIPPCMTVDEDIKEEQPLSRWQRQ